MSVKVQTIGEKEEEKEGKKEDKCDIMH
jgi:hypothetical protein